MAIFPATTTERVKRALGEESPAGAATKLDAQLTQLIPSCSSLIEQFLGTKFQKVARVEVLQRVMRHQRLLFLEAAPIDTAVPVAIRVNLARDFTDAADDLDTTSFSVNGPIGHVYLDNALTGGAGTVRVSYTGGLAVVGANDTASVDALHAVHPIAVDAATLLVAERYRGRKVTSKTGVGGVGFVAWKALPDVVRQMLEPFRRRRIGA